MTGVELHVHELTNHIDWNPYFVFAPIQVKADTRCKYGVRSALPQSTRLRYTASRLCFIKPLGNTHLFTAEQFVQTKLMVVIYVLFFGKLFL